ncbi:DUF979 domain-containing protein [Psychromonas sp. 14N.309.X.WAT.B.A12]|jgi:uncharacterized membrane protein|uniref:DUF979 domain-containing protein n=1 Tax=unclassified Psychromonas TaxID=2614957 RepID=UPI0025B17A3A|nr:DUF979 domain-containing protein [Psychromonas sp. 14N.309.X.WAT.B.A12]MDN2664432.1 DUF979 domain-containing protein [Psychromonas sp. 14N.309.X.WAT.B.A12]
MLEYVYQATGLLLIAFSLQTFVDTSNSKRIGTGLFWLIYGLSFILGTILPDWFIGLMVLALTLIAAGGFMGIGHYRHSDPAFRKSSADKLKNKMFIPALIVPIGTIMWSKLTGTSALIGLGISALLALIVALMITKGKAQQSVHEGRRLIDAIGWAAILSQFLAALGYLFGEAGVGNTVSQIVKEIVPDSNLFAYVLCYTFGMALFTIIMGNAFAAFAVITTGVAVPLLMIEQSGDPIIIGVIGMLSGYCGTLMTPMAANFNIVPAALLELKNKNQVIYMQFFPALLMLAINTLLIYFLAF